MKSYTITVNGVAYDVTVEENTNGAVSAPAAQAPKAASKAAPKAAPKAAASTGAGSVKIASPMQGKILKTPVSVGQAVKKGDVLIVLEAMKMENEIQAEKDGTVASVDVSVGDSVETGQVLITLN
jgi:biotin carboxyl carrier protein